MSCCLVVVPCARVEAKPKKSEEPQEGDVRRRDEVGLGGPLEGDDGRPLKA